MPDVPGLNEALIVQRSTLIVNKYHQMSTNITNHQLPRKQKSAWELLVLLAFSKQMSDFFFHPERSGLTKSEETELILSW